jgi:hypothetical protein
MGSLKQKFRERPINILVFCKGQEYNRPVFWIHQFLYLGPNNCGSEKQELSSFR